MQKTFIWLSLFFSVNAWADTSAWSTAMDLLDQGQTEQAIPLLEERIRQMEASGTRSPEVHHNLAVAFGRLKQWGPAVYHLATSTFLRASPVYGLSALRSFGLVQNQLMIQNGVERDLLFRFGALIPPGFFQVLIVLGIWTVLFGALTQTTRRMGAVLGAIFVLLGGAGIGLRHSLPVYAVVVGSDQGTLLSTEPTLGTDKKLVELPVGTLVTLGPTQDYSIAVQRPFAGWIPVQSIRRIETKPL